LIFHLAGPAWTDGFNTTSFSSSEVFKLNEKRRTYFFNFTEGTIFLVSRNKKQHIKSTERRKTLKSVLKQAHEQTN